MFWCDIHDGWYNYKGVLERHMDANMYYPILTVLVKVFNVP